MFWMEIISDVIDMFVLNIFRNLIKNSLKVLRDLMCKNDIDVEVVKINGLIINYYFIYLYVFYNFYF